MLTRCVRQATHMASGEVSEQTAYQCTGSPLPTDIEAIAQALFNEDFGDVFERIGAMQVTKGLALVDIVQQLLPCAPLLMVSKLGERRAAVTILLITTLYAFKCAHVHTRFQSYHLHT